MIYIVDERLFFQAPPHMQVFIEEFLVNNVHFFLQKLASQLSRPRQKISGFGSSSSISPYLQNFFFNILVFMFNLLKPLVTP